MSSTDDLMNRALAALGEMDGPMSIEVIHRLADTDGLDEPMTIAEVAEELEISTTRAWTLIRDAYRHLVGRVDEF